jgi:hemolysin-activating ACP:hemolysin acyltransferase
LAAGGWPCSRLPHETVAFGPPQSGISADGAIAMQQQPAQDTATVPERPRPELRVFQPENACMALGLAVSHLMTKPAFAKLRFGHWSRILVGQVNRKHYCFVVDARNEIQGFMGWAVTTKENAEAWLEGRGDFSSEESLDGNCVVFNAWSANSLKVNRYLLDVARKVINGKDMVCFKRYYNDGSTRPARLSVNEFVARHIDRKRAAEAA